jgi:hypothetical protein
MTEIDSQTAKSFLLPRHYSGRTPSISKAFGWYSDDNKLVAVCTFGKPASNSLCFGICGKEYSKSVYELNRLCRIDDWKEPLSKFVAYCLRELKKENWIIVSYSDTAMNHHGYIYQACNFIYTGFSAKRVDYCAVGNKHPRHRTGDRYTDTNVKKIRSPKHRYIYFCTNNKKLKKLWQESLAYPIMPYPKGDNSNYVLGEYLEDSYIDNEGIEHRIHKTNNYKYKKKLLF